MQIEFSAFEGLIVFAMALTCTSPIILIGLLIRDWKKGQLW